MKAILLPLALFASAAVAQTSSACGADYIVEACLGSETAKLAACADADYECKCAAHTDILTCYNNCPNDPRIHDAAGQKQIFCGYASQFPNTPTAKVVSGNGTPAATATPTVDPSGAEATGSGSGSDSGGSGSGSGSGSGGSGSSSTRTSTGTAAATTSNSAADLALNAGGVLAAVAGVVIAIL